MKNYRLMLSFLLFIILSSIINLIASDVKLKKNNKYEKVVESIACFNINNFRFPFNNYGVIADADPGDGIGAGGTYANVVILFSGGFFLSGKNNNQIWANGVQSSSRIEDYLPGQVGSSPDDLKNKIYIVSLEDTPFGESWQQWKDAVITGADFYDGDGDGSYNPIDINNNGKWDSFEDCPDILGDWTAWCVYNDGVPKELRRFSVDPKGIEINQTIFGYNTNYDLANMMFVRYRITNRGIVNDKLSDVYFSIATDSDIGDPNDDLGGCDTITKSGFTYNSGVDPIYGDAPPAFLTTILQGPVLYKKGITYEDVDGDGNYTFGIDIALDTAFCSFGPLNGKISYPGACNLQTSSFTQFMQSHPTHGDPNTHLELRNYLLGGRGKNGDSIYVSKWSFGNGATLGSDTAFIPARFMYSGNPNLQNGWLNTVPMDQRSMLNIGSFTLEKDVPVDIYVAYVIGRAYTPTKSVDVALQLVPIAQNLYNENFPFIFTDIEEEINNELEFGLEQNYPNPFNPNTNIKFAIPQNEFVTLKIYDILGREVSTLLNEYRSEGSYNINYNASNLTSGIYFYILRAGELTDSKKMILLK